VDLGRPEEFTARMTTRHYDLLVLCHTLRESDAETISTLAQKNWPDVRILQIVRERWMEGALRPGTAFLSTPEPKRLVERARELLPTVGRA
jgi:hypothetical protein